MTWFKLDDQSAFHPKVVNAGNEAWGALCRAGAWSSGHLTDGFVPWSVAKTIDKKRIWDHLAAVGLIDIKETEGIQIHDFLQWNPSAESVKALREARAEAGRQGGKQKASNSQSKRQATGVAKTYPDPDPKEEETTPLPPKGESPDRRVIDKRRGARLPEGWAPEPDEIAGVAQQFGISPLEVAAELAQFRDYWAAVPGQRGVKLTWAATFRNRLRDQVKLGKIGGHFPPKPSAPLPEPADAPPSPLLKIGHSRADDALGATLPLPLAREVK